MQERTEVRTDYAVQHGTVAPYTHGFARDLCTRREGRPTISGLVWALDALAAWRSATGPQDRPPCPCGCCSAGAAWRPGRRLQRGWAATWRHGACMMGQRCCDGIAQTSKFAYMLPGRTWRLVQLETIYWHRFGGRESGPSRGPAGRLNPRRVDGAGRVPKRRQRR